MQHRGTLYGRQSEGAQATLQGESWTRTQWEPCYEKVPCGSGAGLSSYEGNKPLDRLHK